MVRIIRGKMITLQVVHILFQGEVEVRRADDLLTAMFTQWVPTSGSLVLSWCVSIEMVTATGQN